MAFTKVLAWAFCCGGPSLSGCFILLYSFSLFACFSLISFLIASSPQVRAVDSVNTESLSVTLRVRG